jgi:hypothetical protein
MNARSNKCDGQMMKIGGLIALAVAVASCNAWAGEGFFDDFISPYLQRAEGVTLGAGDAKQVNAAAEIINPWPGHVRDRRIPANGQRMVGAIQRYQDVKKSRETQAPLAPEVISPTGFSGPSAGK